jgi:hypothetical protein
MFIPGPVNPSVVNLLAANRDAFWLVASGGHGGLDDPLKLLPGSRISRQTEFAPFAAGTRLIVPQLYARAH